MKHSRVPTAHLHNVSRLEKLKKKKWHLIKKKNNKKNNNKKKINPLVPDAHYSERQDKPYSLQIQRLEVDLKLNCEF